MEIKFKTVLKLILTNGKEFVFERPEHEEVTKYWVCNDEDSEDYRAWDMNYGTEQVVEDDYKTDLDIIYFEDYWNGMEFAKDAIVNFMSFEDDLDEYPEEDDIKSYEIDRVKITDEEYEKLETQY